MTTIPMPELKGRRRWLWALPTNTRIAYGCARAFRRLGAEIAVTYLNDKARPYVEPLAKELEASIFAKMDVQKPGELEAVFDEIGSRWGELNIALHSIAFAPTKDLQGGLLAVPPTGFPSPWTFPAILSCVMGQACSASDDERRSDVRHELPRGEQGCSKLALWHMRERPGNFHCGYYTELKMVGQLWRGALIRR